MTGRKFFALFLFCVGAPLALAKLSLHQGWFSQGETNNKGKWVNDEVRVPIGKEVEADWYLVYVESGQCQKACEQALYVMQQLYTGLGRKQLKVQILVSAAEKPLQLANYAEIDWIEPKDSLASFNNQILLLNEDGLALLQYSVSEDMPAMIAIAKDIRSDLNRLMNYDRGGL
jgi:hypothetical protein